MRGLWSVCDRELRSLWRQPIAWTVLAFYLFAHGLFFVQLVEQYSTISFQIQSSGRSVPDLTLVDRICRSLLVGDTLIFMLLLPALTMRQVAEEKRSGTLDLLLSYPLREFEVIGGKFLASAMVTLVMVLLGTAEVLALAGFGHLEVDVVLIGATGLFLYGLSVLALGLVFSAWSENQILAFSATLVAQLLLLLIGFWGVRVEAPFDAVLRYLNFTGHVGHFSFGVLRASSTFFFVGLTAFYLYCATALLARHRWHEEG
jgi:gliding motility-associated transport system permease protein